MGKYLKEALHGQLHGTVSTTVVTVSGGPTLLPADPLQGRKDFLLYNVGPDSVYVGGSDVTIANGIPVVAEGYLNAELGRATLYAVVSGTNQNVRVMEIA